MICVDNFFSGQKSNITHLLDNPRFEFIRHDVTQPLFLEADQVYHLACPASPVFYQKDPIYTIKTGVLGTMNMLGLAKRCGARFLITSTSEVYGDPDMHPQKEEYWGNVNMIGIRRYVMRRLRPRTTFSFTLLFFVPLQHVASLIVLHFCFGSSFLPHPPSPLLR